MARQPKPSTPIKAMFCYAHEDRKLRDALDRYLAPLKRQAGIATWFDGEIVPGTEWDEEIRKTLEEAQVILLLISGKFLSSSYGYGKELKRALERHEAKQACVIPVILEPCDWEDEPFARIEALPTKAKPVTQWGSRAAAFTDVAKGIRRAIRRLAPSPPTEPAVSPPSPEPPPPPARPGPILVPRDAEPIITNSIGMKLRLIEPGTFTMGSESGQPSETPVHPVTISKPFYLGICQVTQAQYEAVIGTHRSRFTGSDHPVEMVSWNDTQEFCRRLSEREGTEYRLPTEAEWEYACRAGSTSEYCFGHERDRLGDYAWYISNSEYTTHPVGQKKPNAWGLYDMHGNVSEWCQDWLGRYSGEAETDPTGPAKGTERVLRGGAWVNTADPCRCASRDCSTPELRSSNFGFRVARPLP